MTSQSPPRRGASALFVVGCVLWALVFAGLLAVRFYRWNAAGPEPQLPEGTIAENGDDESPAGESDPEDDGKPKTIVLEIGAERRKSVEAELDEAKARAETIGGEIDEAEAAVVELEAALAAAEGDEAIAEATKALEDARKVPKSLAIEEFDLLQKIELLEVKVEAVRNGWSPDGLPNFELTERSGETVTLENLLGKPFVVAFVFTRCPGPCPRVSLRMNELQEATENLDLRLVTITVDPERDTPEVLRTYAENYGADPERWLFLTGTVDVIYPLIGYGFAMPVQKAPPDEGGGYDVLHTNNLMYVGPEGIVRGKYNSLNDQAFAELKKRLRKEVPKRPKEDTE